MQAFRRALLAIVAVAATTATAYAQETATTNPPATGNFEPIWLGILVLGVPIFVVATSVMVRTSK